MIAPEVWDGIQKKLSARSVKGRTFTGRNRDGARPSVSRLAGKMFDQTGARLTPSHSESANGRRLRYYVSHRLVRGTAPRDPSGWRFPAPELEKQVSDLVVRHMMGPEFRAGIISDASTDETAELAKKLSSSGGTGSDFVADARNALLDIIDRTRISEDLLSLTSPFQHRKRGVETRLILGDKPVKMDETLLRNIGRAHRYFDQVRPGKSFGEIAETEGVSKRRIQQLIELAFPAPDNIRSVRDGRQSVGLTSEWLMRHALAAIWSEQRQQFAAL